MQRETEKKRLQFTNVGVGGKKEGMSVDGVVQESWLEKSHSRPAPPTRGKRWWGANGKYFQGEAQKPHVSPRKVLKKGEKTIILD